jgi:hypothetical protein
MWKGDNYLDIRDFGAKTKNHFNPQGKNAVNSQDLLELFF